jgi:hypothetical protein
MVIMSDVGAVESLPEFIEKSVQFQVRGIRTIRIFYHEEGKVDRVEELQTLLRLSCPICSNNFFRSG